MKFISLEIKNIASIEHAEIQFMSEPLAGSGVFLISGNTGAGKSTILDCICLALYNETPRLRNCKMNGNQLDVDKNEYKLNDPRLMLRRGSGSGSVSLVFVGNDDVKYRADWAVRRARNAVAGKLQSRLWSFREEESGRLVAEKEKDIKELLNRVVDLDFDQFCRTTMLAQGDFNLFLNSNDQDKSAILEKILGSSIYTRIGKELYEITSEKRRHYENVERDIKAINLLKEEEREEYVAKSNLLLTKIVETRDELKRWSERDKWLREDELLVKETEKAHAAYQSAQSEVNEESYKRNQQLVSDWHNASVIRQINCDMTQLNRSAKALKAKEPELEKELKKLCRYGSAMSEEIDGLRVEEQKLFKEDYLRCDVVGVPEYKGPGMGSLRGIEEEWIAELEKWESGLDDGEIVEKLTILGKEKALLTLYAEVSGNYNRELTRHKEEKKQLLSQRKTIARLEKDIERSEKREIQLKQIAEQAKMLYEKQKSSVDTWARDIRRNLRAGDVCPVCMSTIQQALPSEADFERLIAPIEENCKATQKSWESAMREVMKLRGELDSASKTYVRSEKKHVADEKNINSLSEKLDNLADEVKQLVEEGDNSDISELIAERTEKETELQQNLKQIGVWRNFVREKRKDFNNRRARAEQFSTRRDELSSKLKEISTCIINISQKKDWDLVVEKSSAKVTKVNPQELWTAIVENEASQNSVNQQIASKTLQLKSERANHRDWSDEYIKELMATDEERITEMETSLKKAAEKLTRAEECVALVSQRVKTHIETRPEMDSEVTIGLCEERNLELEHQLQKDAEEKGKIEQILRSDDSEKLRSAELLKRLETVKGEYQRWENLNMMLGSADGKKFRKIALSYVLENLVTAANSYMKSLFPRYELSVRAGDYTIYVRDNYCDGTERAASGISGGETFIVSLALALALADIGGRVAPDILFIDEGFGSLSGEPLNRAIETLRRLSVSSGRQVGIISHIEELRERLPVQIRVEQLSGSASSSVKVLPEM